ncbi:expressed unknown protein [Seminavis robusta]|uniref:Uncharacterized protein n=1 Tax=Seminavis robusta TaxID=568900 RepID=A0A9N8E8U0_9STRA|nr:expressed unknown protein [Seminavis robusta]|eukprot:Sro781_g201660.1 n/a (188) ;mRNA; f:40018-40816
MTAVAASFYPVPTASHTTHSPVTHYRHRKAMIIRRTLSSLWLFALLVFTTTITATRLARASSDSDVVTWSDADLRCLNEMEFADNTSYDHILAHQEFFAFVTSMANQLVDLGREQNALDVQEVRFELDDVFNSLVDLNPSGEPAGVDILGAAYGQLEKADVEQQVFLKLVCNETIATIYSLLPGDAY